MPDLSNLAELVNRLRESEGGDPELDRQLLEFLGFREDAEGNVLSSYRGRYNAWIPPNGGDPVISPRCTAVIDDAIKVASAMIGARLNGVSWEAGQATAQIDGGPFIQAKTPQAAICLAVLHDLASSGHLTSGSSKSTTTHKPGGDNAD